MTSHPCAFRTLALLGSLALSACAHSASPTSETAAMNAPAAPSALPDSRTLLQSLADLLGSVERIQDITADRVQAAMNVPVQAWTADSFGFGGHLAPEWSAGLQVNRATMNGPQLTFSFEPLTPGATPPASDTCGLDFEGFDAALRKAGFEGAPQYGEHGRVLAQRYRRAQLQVSVDWRSEVPASDDAQGRRCVARVVVN